MFGKWEWSDVTSTAAILISIATFIWTRVDKWRERRAIFEARKPLVNINLRSVAINRWQVSVRIQNRGDFDLRWDRISVHDKFSLNFGDGNGAAATHVIDQHIPRYENAARACDLVRASGSTKKLRFFLEFTTLGPSETQIKIRVRRKLPLFE
jgi:hypothetical protein